MRLARVRVRGHGAESEAPAEAVQWQIARWRRGKAIWWCLSRNKVQALEAAGLSE